MNRGKQAVITGATSGIGAAVAGTLAAAGVRVFLVGRNARKLMAASRRIPRQALAGTALADLSSVAEIRRLLQDIAARMRRLDLLIHCAGEYYWSEPASLESATFERMYAVNVRAPYLLTQGLTPLLARARGQVVFLNSSVVKGTGEGVAGYKATQHAVQGFTDSLRQDLNRHRVRVTSLYPGRTATPRMRRIYAHERKRYRPRILLSAREVAEVVLALTQLPQQVEITDVHLRSVTPY